MAGNQRYMLYKKVARGGMAEIYLGKQLGEDGFQRICCIKRILPHFAQDNEFITMFRDEAHICKRLQHANIVRVEGFEEVDGSYAMIMEFINGGDLRTVLSSCEKMNTKLSVAMSLYVIAEAARGLHYAHCKVDELSGKPLEIVHRDISPQNILLSFEGEVKVTDFGIADADNKATETKPGIVKGKYSYMSPEQISAKPVDARTDVFALSIVLWEMLAMRRLFQGENEVMTIQKVRACQIDYDLRALNTGVDEELYQIIDKGLRKDQRERYASAAEMERALRRYLGKHVSDFTMSDLGDFLKEIMSSRREEMQEEIKNLLSKQMEVTQEPEGESTTIMPTAGDNGAGAEASPVDLSLEPASVDTPAFELRGGGTSQAPGFTQPVGRGQQGGGGPGTAFPQSGTAHGASRIQQPQTRARAAGTYTNVGAATRLPQNLGGAQKKNQNFSRGRSSSGRGAFFLFVFFLVVLSAIGVVAYKKKFFAGGADTVEVLVTPTVVKISLNGKPLFGGQYIETPLKIIPTAKKNEYVVRSQKYEDGPFNFRTERGSSPYNLLFRRTGYTDEAFKFSAVGDIGKKYIVLARVTDMAPTRISLSQPGKKIYIKVDEGEVMGSVETGKPLDANDITFGTIHRLYVYPNGFQETKGAFRCKFSPRAQSWSAPFLVKINVESKTCVYPPR